MSALPNFPTCHSHPFSFDSGSTPDAFVKREVELGTGAVCVTDHGTLAAARHIYKAAKKHGITPILGLEGYVRDDDCPILAQAGIVKQPESEKPDARVSVSHYMKYMHLTMHALDQAGFETMCKVLSRREETAERHGQERKPIFTWSDIEELGGANITFGSGCLVGMVQRHLLEGRPELAIRYYQRLRSMAKPGNFFVEAFPHRCDKNWVRGVFMTFGATENGICEDERRYNVRKNLRVRYDGAVEELRAEKLVEMWDRWMAKGKAMPKVELLAVKHYQTWKEEPEPLPVDGVRQVEDFLQNECQPWCPDGDVQRGANEFVIRLAKKYGDPILVSDDSHFARPEEKVVQDVRLLSMEHDNTKGSAPNWRFYGSYHRQTSQEAFAYFKQYLGTSETEFRGWVENSLAWSKRFGWKFQDRKQLPTKFYPEDTLGHTMKLIQQVGRMDWKNQAMKERLTREIKMLHQNGTIDLLPYFFIDQEVCAEAERRGDLTGTGRGSAAGLLLTYLLGITHVDPLRYQLSMERFLTESRIRSGKLPDIDQDLGDREWLLDPKEGWLKKRFGDCCAQISTDTMLRLKSSIQDVHRVKYGRVDPDIFILTQKMQKPPQGIEDIKFVFGYKDADGNPVQGSIETDPALKEYVERYPEEWNTVVKALGIVRQKSRHASAYVVTNEPVSNFIPLTVVGDVPVTQFNMHGCEDAGAIKMDFLGLITLKWIQGAIKLVQKHHGYEPKDERIGGKRVPGIRVVPHRVDGELRLYDVWELPDDQDVFQDICAGHTETVFQFGTPAAKQWLGLFYKDGKHTLRNVEDLSAFTALDRPGPLNYFAEDERGEKRNMLQEFAARAAGEKPIGALPILNELFPETYGIIVYQEQLQKAFQVIGQTTAEQGDEFRVHVSKKKMEDVLKDKAVFMPGAIKMLGEKDAETLWQMLETFGQYGFNKSHSTCYALTGLVCAWLKKKYPLQWWCSVLQHSDREKIDQKFWMHCRDMVLPPDVKMSQDDFTIEGDHIRAPLRLLNGIGPKAHEELVANRPYVDIRDFCMRLWQRRLDQGEVTTTEVVSKRTGKAAIKRKVKLAPTALNNTILTKLIVSGVADSLFSPEVVSVYDKLRVYTEVMAEGHNKVAPRARVPWPQEPIDSRFLNLSPLQRYQLKKSILPSYTEPLWQMVYTLDREDFGVEKNKAWFRPARPFEGNPKVPVLPGALVKRMMEQPEQFPALNAKFKFGVVGYVTEVEPFWGGKAMKIHFEVDGERLKSAKWPERKKVNGETKQIPVKLPEDLVGSVVILGLSRWNYGKYFGVDDIVVVQPAFNLKAKESPTAEGSAE